MCQCPTAGDSVPLNTARHECPVVIRPDPDHPPRYCPNNLCERFRRPPSRPRRWRPPCRRDSCRPRPPEPLPAAPRLDPHGAVDGDALLWLRVRPLVQPLHVHVQDIGLRRSRGIPTRHGVRIPPQRDHAIGVRPVSESAGGRNRPFLARSAASISQPVAPFYPRFVAGS